jgi:AcrR family transcriptional regulator
VEVEKRSGVIRVRRLDRLNAVKQHGVRPGTWQARKSELTRQDTLDAAVRCLVKYGYAGTSTTTIAREAGISRGAATHHFPTKRALVEAAIEQLADRRRRDFRERIQAIRAHTADPTAGLDGYWDHLRSPETRAFQQVLIVARTDPELAEIVGPRVAQFERAWTREVYDLFPEWRDAGPAFEQAMNLSQFLMEGMAMHDWVVGQSARYDQVRHWLADQVRFLLRDSQPTSHPRGRYA